MNSLKIDKKVLELARKQFCLDIGLPWEAYEQNSERKVYIRKAVYKENSLKILSEGARDYEGRNDFFHAMICLGQLFLVVDEQIYDWALEKFWDCPPEWFCEFENLRMIDEKLKEFGHSILDTHVYFLPEEESMGAEKKSLAKESAERTYVWYNQEEILNFKEKNRFSSAICFSQTQPDVLAVVAMKGNASAKVALTEEKIYDQLLMDGMAGVSKDGKYLWQIGINVDRSAEGKGLAGSLVRMLKDEVLRQGKIPFYGTNESHTVSQTVGLKAGFVPAWTEVYVR